MSSSSAEPKPLAGLRILIAEDSWHLAMALQQALECAGATVAGVAPSLEQAEHLAKSAIYDVAVMDINLNEEMTTRLVARMAEQGRKVIVMSGYDLEPTFVAKVHACLSKPTTPQVLIDAILKPQRAD